MTSHADIEAIASEWLARRDGQQWSDDLQRELDAWLDCTTAHRVAYLRLESAWLRTHRMSALQRPMLDGMASERAPRPRNQSAAWRFAAALLAITLLAAGGSYWLSAPSDMNYQSALGARRDVILADGTHILLNTETKLRANIDGHRRHARLVEGEAYFEIAHDATRPFVVDVGDYMITVLGTKFAVRRDGTAVRVSVVEGKVRLEAKQPGEGKQTLVLTQNELAVATSSTALMLRRTVDQTSSDLSWRAGKITFHDDTLQAAALEFNRYNAKKLVLTDQRAAQVRIGGSFNADNVEAFARLLHDGFGLKVRDDGSTIRVSGSGEPS